MSNSPKKPTYTIDDIIQRKEETVNKIRTQHQIMSSISQDIFAPFLPSSSQEGYSFIKRLNTGMIVFNGVMTGFKLFKNIRKVFYRK